MVADAPSPKVLEPSLYQSSVVDYFKRYEPAVWAWASSFEAGAETQQEMRASLLRETYRLSHQGHGEVYGACAAAMKTLGIEAEVALYQAGTGDMNAALIYSPGQVEIIFHGPILERLNPAELAAVLGHELAHYRLWSGYGGDFHTAARILDHSLVDPQAAASHIETARLYGLHTELYADRGAALAAAAAGPAITTLVKVRTGLAHVDADAYLAQAEEVERDGASLSQGQSHPETYLRAQAVNRWWDGDPDLPGWLERRLHGPLGMDRLNLVGQVRLQALTRRFAARFLAQPEIGSESVLAQVRGFFPDWSGQEPAVTVEELSEAQIDDSVRDYLAYVGLDLALADPDRRDLGLAEAARAAQEMGRLAEFQKILKRDVGLGKREIDALAKRMMRGPSERV